MITAALIVGVVLFLLLVLPWLTVRYIPNDRIGIVEKLWSAKGSLTEGAVIALNGEAGYQADILRGGIHFGLWRWQYKIHKFPLVTIKQGKIGYVFSRGGDQLLPSQTLARVIECNNFQDARKFLANSGQKGRQRGILREGVYAINIALFNVITEDRVFTLEWAKSLEEWQHQLKELQGFSPLDHQRPDRSNRNRDRPRRSDLAPRRTDCARRGHRQGPAELPQQLPGHRGISGRRRPSRRPIYAVDRRHLFPQPLVLHG